MKHYLVTGGCGFIGFHLVQALVQNGYKVTILDDLSNNISLRQNMSQSPYIEFRQGNILDIHLLESLMDIVAGCFHLAAITSAQTCNENWELAHEINATGTLRVFSQAKKRRVPIVYASSAAVYGQQQKFPIKENAPIHPISSYGTDKHYCELLGRIASILFGVPNIGIRFFNVYGPFQNHLSPYSGVISRFIHKAINDENIIINGDGSQIRDFIYISDAIEILLKAMEMIMQETNNCLIVNGCTGIETSIKELAFHIIDLTGSKGRYVHFGHRKGDIHASIGDPQLLENMLGIIPKTSLIDGLKETIGWMKKSASYQSD